MCKRRNNNLSINVGNNLNYASKILNNNIKE